MARKRKMLTAAQIAHRKRQAVKKRKRNRRERELASRIKALPDKRYGVILADPPWRFEVYSRDTGMDRAADNHYPTQTLAEMMALPVPNIAAGDCALFLWSTNPHLRDAMLLIEAWGFKYKSNAVWDKVVPIMGYWFRARHELLLIATRGNPPAPSPGTQPDSLLTQRRSKRHSEKPAVIAELIEEWYPNLPKIELYARCARRDGWDEPWGAEAGGVEPTATRPPTRSAVRRAVDCATATEKALPR